MSKLLNRHNLLNKIVRNYLFTSRLQTCSEKISSTEVVNEPKEDVDILSYVDISDEFKTGVNVTTRKLEQLFAMKKYDAVNIISKNKFLAEVPGKIMSDNYELLQQHNIKDETILKCLHLLAEKCLLEKIYILQQLDYDINVLAPLLKLNILSLNAHVKNGELLHRISFLSNLLRVSKFVVCEYMVKRQFLFTLKLEKTETICHLLYENGVSNEEILKDMWVLRYSRYTIEERIEYAKSQKVEKLKTWMIRGIRDIIDKHVQRKSENKLVLGDHTLVEYLSEKLDCSIDQATGFVLKYPALRSRSLKKVQEIIEFLYSNGFMPTDLFRCPKILFFNVDTIKKRMKQMEGYNLQSVGLHVFIKSQKQFDEYHEALIKSKKRKRKRQLQ